MTRASAADEALSPQDAKLVTLARTVRARNHSAEGAAVRDADGRTYAASSVNLPSLQLTALQTAVAMAVSSGVRAVEAAVVVTTADPPAVRLEAVHDLGGRGVPVHVATWEGDVVGVVHS